MASLAELLGLLPTQSSPEGPTAFAALAGRIESLVGKLSAGNFTNNLAAEIRANAASVAVEVMRGSLDAAIPWTRKNDLRRLRSELLGSIAPILETDNLVNYLNGDNTAQTVRQSLLSSLPRLQLLEASSIRTRSVLRWTIAAVVALATGGAAAALAGTYLASRSGFEIRSAEVHAPIHLRSSAAGRRLVLSIGDADRSQFMRSFAPYYFGRPSDFSQLFIEDPKSQGAAGPYPHGLPILIGRLKLDLRSRTRIGTSYVSAVGVRLQLIDEETFPWREIQGAPRLTSEYHGPAVHHQNAIEPFVSFDDVVGHFYLRNEGVGPALHVRSKVSLESGPILQTETTEFIHDTRVPLRIAEPGEEISPWPLEIAIPRSHLHSREFTREYQAEPWAVATEDGSPRVLHSLYARLAPGATPADPETSFTHEEQAYEVISTISGLQKYTEVYYERRLELQVDYESLSGQRFMLRRSEPPLLDWCFYRRNESLREFDPRMERPAPPKRGAPVLAAPSALAEAFASQFARPDSDPMGVDHLTLDADFDLRGLREGESVGKAIMVDRFINARGTISVYIKLTGQCTGRWEATISVDDSDLGRVEFETLVPEVMRFPRYDKERSKELVRLKWHMR